MQAQQLQIAWNEWLYYATHWTLGKEEVSVTWEIEQGAELTEKKERRKLSKPMEQFLMVVKVNEEPLGLFTDVATLVCAF